MSEETLFTPDVETYLREVRIPLRLACVTPSGWPVVLSLWYLYREGWLYCATQKQAKVVTYLRQQPQCAFEVAADQPPYCGLRGQGLVTLEESLGVDILQQLISRYLGRSDLPLAQKLLARSQNEIALVIQPVSLFKWNFSERMIDSLPGSSPKPCPA